MNVLLNVPRHPWAKPEVDELMFEGVLPKSLLDTKEFKASSDLDSPSSTGKRAYKVRLGKK